ncbi:MAG: ABC transporter substrate-binding protein [Desulfurococcaceae archaeon]
MERVSLTLRYTKTVKLELLLDSECRIENMSISGDFFAYPEDAVELLEQSIRGCKSAECVERAFGGISIATFLGIDIDDLKTKVIMAIERCSERLRLT